jgi:hypothetical protein
MDSLLGCTGNFISKVSQTTEFADVFGTDFRKQSRLPEIFAVVSLLRRYSAARSNRRNQDAGSKPLFRAAPKARGSDAAASG